MNRWSFFLLTITGCTPKVMVCPHPLDLARITAVHFHVDRSFAGDRTMWLEQAAWQLESDTRGKLRVEYTYDLDFDGRIQIVPPGEWYLVDLPAASDITGHFDKKHGVNVLGECDTEHRIVYLVRERLEAHDRFVHTTMHEILHAVGVVHAEGARYDAHAIMAAIVVPHLPLRMNSTDLELFCEKIGCRASEVRP